MKGKLYKLMAQGLHLLNGTQAKLTAEFEDVWTGLNEPPETIKPPLHGLDTLMSLSGKLRKQAGITVILPGFHAMARKESIKTNQVLEAKVESVARKRVHRVRSIAQKQNPAKACFGYQRHGKWACDPWCWLAEFAKPVSRGKTKLLRKSLVAKRLKMTEPVVRKAVDQRNLVGVLQGQ